MNSLWVVMTSLLLTLSFGEELDELPRRPNAITGVLNKILGDLPGKTLNIPDIDLTEKGKFWNVKAGIFGELTKEIDGIKSWGIKLDTTMTSLTVKGQYYIVNLDVPGLFPIFGKGDFMIVLDLNFNMTFAAETNLDDNFDVDLSRFIISVNNATVRLENLMNDPYLADFLSELLSSLLPKVVTMAKEPLFETVKWLSNRYGSGILKCIRDESSNILPCVLKLFNTKNQLNFDVNLKTIQTPPFFVQ